MKAITSHQQTPEKGSGSSDPHRRLRLFIALLFVFGIVVPITYSLVFAYGTDYPQCDPGKVAPLTCDFVPGLTGSNDLWMEGMLVPQRAMWWDLPDAAQGLPGPVYTYTWWISAVQSTHHGYDFTASYTDAIKVNRLLIGDGFVLDPCDNDVKPDKVWVCQTIVSPTTPVNRGHIQVPFPFDSFESGTTIGAPLNRYYSTHQQAFIDQYVPTGALVGDLYANNYITAAIITMMHTENEGDDTPISDTLDVTAGGTNQTWIRYQLVFTTSASMVGFFYAPHLSVSGNTYLDAVAWGSQLGAASITGSSWHVKDSEINGVGGSQDNQVKLSSGAPYPIESNSTIPISPTIGVSVTDSITVVQSLLANGNINGEAAFYICSDTTAPYTDTLANGCLSRTGGNGFTTTFVGTSTVTTIGNASYGLGTSPPYTPTHNGRYCWLVYFTSTLVSGLYNYPPTGDTNGTSECFNVDSPTAVRISAFTGNSPPDLLVQGYSIPILLIGLLGMAASFGLWKFGFHHN